MIRVYIVYQYYRLSYCWHVTLGGLLAASLRRQNGRVVQSFRGILQRLAVMRLKRGWRLIPGVWIVAVALLAIGRCSCGLA